jgi:NitT/TauT family transport system ATP-binding protein
MTSAGGILMQDVSKSYISGGAAVLVLEAVSLEVKGGEFVAVVGPSGCGKTTLLRVIAGLTRADRGRVLAAGDLVDGPSARRAMVFQDHALFPWLTVVGNIGFGLKLQRVPRQTRLAKVNEYVERFGLRGFDQAYPDELSGGMRQRVALARTLITEPEILLLDEPFGSLDARTREDMQDFLQEVEKDRTTVLVTHDIREAAYLADRVVVLTSRPASTTRIVAIELPVPRNRAMTHEPYFVSVVRELDELLRSGAHHNALSEKGSV